VISGSHGPGHRNGERGRVGKRRQALSVLQLKLKTDYAELGGTWNRESADADLNRFAILRANRMWNRRLEASYISVGGLIIILLLLIIIL